MSSDFLGAEDMEGFLDWEPGIGQVPQGEFGQRVGPQRWEKGTVGRQKEIQSKFTSARNFHRELIPYLS